MKWKAKRNRNVTTVTIKTRFAWTPVLLSNDHYIWLERYKEQTRVWWDEHSENFLEQVLLRWQDE